MTTMPVHVSVSAATRLYGSCSRQASRMASDTWSAILSGWPSVTDSEVNRERSLNFRLLPIEGISNLRPSGVVRPCHAVEQKLELNMAAGLVLEARMHRQSHRQARP